MRRDCIQDFTREMERVSGNVATGEGYKGSGLVEEDEKKTGTKSGALLASVKDFVK